MMVLISTIAVPPPILKYFCRKTVMLHPPAVLEYGWGNILKMGAEMKKIACIFVLLLLTGCGPKIYENTLRPDAGQYELDLDINKCHSYATGSTPMPSLAPVPQPTTTQGYGTVTSGGMSSTYFYNQTSYPNSYQKSAIEFSNASNQFMYMAMIQRRQEECMESLGWREVQKNTHTEYNEKKPTKNTDSPNGKNLTIFDANNTPKTATDIEECTIRATNGDISAQKSLGKLYEGSGDKSIKWYEMAANQGDAEAEYLLGILYLFDKKYIDGEDIAIKWLTKSSEKGNSNAQCALASIYEESKKNKNGKKSIELYTLSANSGNIHAQSMLGFAYLLGEYVKVDHQKSFNWFLRAAEQGDKVSQYQVGKAYLFGTGVSKDSSLAAIWLDKSSSQGDREAKAILGILYFNGTGVPRDIVRSANLLLEAAALKHKKSLLAISRIYEKGMGLTQNYYLSYICANLSLSEGENDALKQKEKMEKQLSKSQLADAEKVISRFKYTNDKAERLALIEGR